MKKRDVGVFCVFLYTMLLFSGCFQTSSTDSLSDYLKTDVPLTYSEFKLFPSDLSEETVNTYRSVSKSSFFFDDVYFLLDCIYDDEQYVNEINRLSSLGAEYSEDNFLYPAYIMLCSGKFYEYALIDSESNRVVYVAAQTADWDIFDDFPQIYIPQKQNNVNICCYS